MSQQVEAHTSALLSLPLPVLAVGITSIMTIGYGTWLITKAKHDCPKVFALFAVAGALIAISLLIGRVCAVAATGVVYDGLSELHQLYDLFQSAIGLLVLFVLHKVHTDVDHFTDTEAKK